MDGVVTNLWSRLTILGVCLVSLLAGAREGFHLSLKDAPPAVVAAWPSVFALVNEVSGQYHTSTAFVVARHRTKSSHVFYLLTVNHGLGPCREAAYCPSLKLLRDLQIFNALQNRALSAEIIDRGSLAVDHVYVLNRLRDVDLAIVRVQVPLGTRDLPAPIALPSTCTLTPGEPIYTVGFPAVIWRAALASALIEQPQSQVKRWSEGVFSNLGTDPRNGRLFFTATTDALVGNSGGPLLNTRGEAVSVQLHSSSVIENDFRYTGREAGGVLSYQLKGALCPTLAQLKVVLASEPGVTLK